MWYDFDYGGCPILVSSILVLYWFYIGSPEKLGLFHTMEILWKYCKKGWKIQFPMEIF